MRTNEQYSLVEEAAHAIKSTLESNQSKHGDSGFRNHSSAFHLLKAVRHIMTHMLLRDSGVSDTEGHLRNALTRLAMALVVGR
jgi:hypothetical protein